MPSPEPFSRIYHRLADEFAEIYDYPGPGRLRATARGR